MRKSTEIKRFIARKPYLFWSIGDTARHNISEELLVESVLQYGDEKDVRKLFKIIGLYRTAEIFFSQTSKARNNYKLRTLNFFILYFNRHAPGNIKR
jgi:hypothetical protein